MNSILVTGASGFIGRNLIPKLCDVSYNVLEVNSKFGDIAEEITWLKYPKAEVVIHLAGKTFVPESWDNPVEFIKCNLLGTIGALNYCKNNSARLIYMSSYLYGNPKSLPIPETAPLVANNPYSLSKKLAEEACQFYSNNFGINIIILRPFNVYGPGQPEHFLIPSIIRQVNTCDVIKVKDIEPKRDYLYVSDLVQSIIKAVNCNNRFSIYNIGSGVSYSVEELISIIQNIKNTYLPVYSSVERRRDEIMDTIADITAAKQQLGWEPRISLHQGLLKMFKSNNSSK